MAYDMPGLILSKKGILPLATTLILEITVVVYAKGNESLN